MVGSMEDIGYLIGALGDGGLYYLRYKGKRSEYRVSWTQGSLEYLEKSIIPRLRRVLCETSINSKIQILRGATRFEVRVSSKKLYMLFKELAKPENIVKMPRVARIAFVRGLYDAEGDKSKKRIRIWSKNVEVLNIAKQVLAELGIDSKGPYLDDKRRGVYVVEVPRAYASQFYSIIKPEHPKLGVDTGPHPRKFRRA